MTARPPAALRRLATSIRAHPRRTGLLAAAIVVVLVLAVVATLVRTDDAGPAGSSGPASSPSTVAGPSAGSNGGPPTTAGSTGAGGGEQPPPSGGGQPGATGPPGQRGTGAPAVPGTSPPDVGGGPVALRPPVRCSSSGAPKAGALPSVDERDGRRWVTVGRLAGSCDAASPEFRLLGIDTRLVWRSDADSFVVFVVDAVQGREATAGFADGECAGACTESQTVVLTAGSYRLEVQAGNAPWEVEIQEYRRP